ncbi:hypothetical protein J5474_19655, partial [Sagittula sp. M10.9X]|nr:hypothetical protein [Sagittula salina]
MKKDHPDLSLRRQCRLLSLARSTLYYQPRGESAENLKLMEIIDRQFLETPWYVVIPPFLTGCIRRTYAAIFSFWAGVM